MSEFYRETAPPNLAKFGFEFFAQQKVNEGITTTAHIHPAIEFIYITDGNYVIGIDNEQIEASPGDLILFHANVIHTICHVGKGIGKYFVLKVHPAQLFRFFLGSDNNECVIPFLHKREGDRSKFPDSMLPAEVKDILNKMMAEYNSADKFFIAIERAYFAAFLIALSRTLLSTDKQTESSHDINEKSVSLIYETVIYINENYAFDITPADCAERIHLSYSYFAKLFRAVMGKTFKEYLTSVRLAKAHNLLLSSDISVTEVALSCGYSNLSYFISEYRHVYGSTPKETQKNFSKT